MVYSRYSPGGQIHIEQQLKPFSTDELLDELARRTREGRGIHTCDPMYIEEMMPVMLDLYDKQSVIMGDGA